MAAVSQSWRGHRADGRGEGIGIGFRDLTEGREAGALERRLEMRRKVGKKRDRLASQERGLVARQHDQQAARPRPGGGDAGRQARARQTQRGVEAEPSLDLVLDALGGGRPAPARSGRLG